MEIRNQFILLSGFIVASFAMIGWGISTNSLLSSQLLISAGGAILGASISNILGVINSKKVYDFMVGNSTEQFTSDENSIRDFRKLYYIYWVSSLNNEAVWMYTTMDFGKSSEPGKLQADFYPGTPEGKRVLYKSNAILRGQRLIQVDRALVGNEPPAILIYPNFGKDYTAVNYGFGYYETFEHNEILAPVILSEKVLANWNTEGYLDQTSSDILWDMWEKNMGVVSRPGKIG